METIATTQPSTRLVQGVRKANQERYARVNQAWPKDTPAMTFEEGRAATKLLWRFATKRKWPSGWEIKWRDKRWTNLVHGTLYINHRWDDLVHTLSHYTWGRVKPAGHDDHGTGHASHEYMLIQEVIKRGWLQGKLKRPERPKIVKDVKAERYKAAQNKLKQWQSKAKRADTAIKKLKQTIYYYEHELNMKPS